VGSDACNNKTSKAGQIKFANGECERFKRETITTMEGHYRR